MTIQNHSSNEEFGINEERFHIDELNIGHILTQNRFSCEEITDLWPTEQL